MGEKCLDLKTEWEKIIVDEFVGGGAIIGSVFAACAVAMMLAFICLGAEATYTRTRDMRIRFFGGDSITNSDGYTNSIIYSA